MRTHTIDNVELILSHPDELDIHMVGAYELQNQLEACWLTVEENDLPLTPRLLGRPGVGKTTLAYSVARKSKQDVFIYQCTMDTRPEDLIITPVISENRKIKYHASGIVTAMITGGIAILDEGNRMSEKAWASLAPLFDNRRYVESITAGIKIKAHKDFRCCVTMNDDSSTFEVPEYIMSRLQPQIYIDFPTREEEKEILKVNIPYAKEDLLERVSLFLSNAHRFQEPFTSRDGVHIIRYAMKLINRMDISYDDALYSSIEQVLGNDAVNYIDPDYQPQFTPQAENFVPGFDFSFTQSDTINDEDELSDYEDDIDDYEDDDENTMV